ncbi:hypothetical protein [Mycolicibacterium helvum]|uniref:Uncharacterized protein n=1 Tax=Mycolicibacterium helvum TaxID=1534349 RepID=A0A7I7TDG5_9MYCO|nr:hypothetical protein [Mycolicibacterium helvum]BBY66611.1 hypothetical protein MHEL_48540 [Mycolicibacterium helvum]
MMTMKNRLAGFLAAPAITAAVLGGALTLAGPASADTWTYNDYSGSDSYGVHPNNEIVVAPDTYADPAPVYTPWATWLN